jgi:hypothetical protein
MRVTFVTIKRYTAKLLAIFSITCAAQTNSIVELRGTNLLGGAQKQFGSVFYGQTAVNSSTLNPPVPPPR